MDIKGNINLLTGGNSEIRNVVAERLPFISEPAAVPAEKGRIYCDTTNNVYRFNNGTSYQQFATGSVDTDDLQTETDNIEAALGSFVNADGTFNEVALNALSNISGLTSGDSLVAALTQLDAAITAAAGVDELGELIDVTLTAPSAGQVLRFTGTGDSSVNATLVLDDLGDITITGNVSGDVVYNNGSGFVHGSPGATSGVQAHDATLDDLASLGIVADDEIMVGTGAGTFAYESGAVARASLGAQTQGDVLDDLNTLGAVVSDGDIIVGTGAGTFGYESGAVARASLGLTIDTDVQGFDVNLEDLASLGVVADNDFIVGNGVGSYEYQNEASVRNTLGLESGGVGDIWVEKTGDTMSGALNMGSNLINSVSDPLAADDAATKNYVDSIASGLDVKRSVRATSTGVNLTLSGLQTIDGVSLIVGDRFLVRHQIAGSENGIYDVAVGSWVRSSDANISSEVTSGMFTFVEEGVVSADYGFVLTTNDTIILDTTSLVFSQFTGAGSISAGVGLSQDGNIINANLGAGIAELPTDEIGVDLFDFSSGALILTDDGTSRGTGTDNQLYLLLDGTSMGQSVSGLTVANGGVTETHINSTALGDGLQGGSGTTLSVDLVVASGLVITGGELDLDSIPNSAFTNSDITFAGDSGTPFTRDLGTTMTVAGGSNLVSTAAAGTVTLDWSANITDLGDVSAVATTAGDVLRSNGTSFVNVPASTVVGDVDIDDLSNVSGVSVSNEGDVLSSDGAGNVVARKVFHKYVGVAATSHVISHNLGQRHCVVTVIDTSNNEMVIPESVTFDSTSQLTVTFNESLACTVVMVGMDVG